MTPTAPTSVNAITLTRYRVTYSRADGRNTPGVDVPYGFDGAMTRTIALVRSVQVSTSIWSVTRIRKSLPSGTHEPAAALAIIITIAEVTFYGRDQAGNEVTVTGSIDVHFGDFGERVIEPFDRTVHYANFKLFNFGVLVLATLAGCTKDVEIPALAGPSTFARSIVLTAEKDTLMQNGLRHDQNHR